MTHSPPLLVNVVYGSPSSLWLKAIQYQGRREIQSENYGVINDVMMEHHCLFGMKKQVLFEIP